MSYSHDGCVFCYSVQYSCGMKAAQPGSRGWGFIRHGGDGVLGTQL